jgi:TFIIF-interacting CTD phosphatase-like protein
MSDEKIQHKDYTTHSSRVLNRLISLRNKQIKKLESGHPTTDKTLLQLTYEREAMINTLLERSMTKDSDPKSR